METKPHKRTTAATLAREKIRERRPITKKELAAAYEIHSDTLRKWLRHVPGIIPGGRRKYLSSDELQLIFLSYGNPV